MQTQFTVVWTSGNKWNQTGGIFPSRKLAESALSIEQFAHPTLRHAVAEILTPALSEGKSYNDLQKEVEAVEAEPVSLGGAA